MADDKSKTDQRDRAKVAGGEDYEVRYMAERMGITVEEARVLGRALWQRPQENRGSRKEADRRRLRR